MRFRIDNALNDSVSGAREREWQLSLTELNYETDGEPPTLRLVRRKDGGVDVHVLSRDPSATGPNETLIGVVAFGHNLLKPHFRSYRRVIEQLVHSTATGTRQMETLDYAKKLVHDEAGEMVQGTLKGQLPIEHGLARRLFTLIFLICNELPAALVTRHRHG